MQLNFEYSYCALKISEPSWLLGWRHFKDTFQVNKYMDL